MMDNESANAVNGRRSIFEVIIQSFEMMILIMCMTRMLNLWYVCCCIEQIPKDLETLHSRVDEWSLAEDAGLLHVLEEFSTRMKSEIRLVEKSLDELVFDTKTCHVSLKNTFTTFAMLSNKQVCF